MQRIKCAFKLKLDGIPMIQLRNSGFYGDHEYVRETVEPVTISLTCIDLQLLFENYEVDVYEWLGVTHSGLNQENACSVPMSITGEVSSVNPRVPCER